MALSYLQMSEAEKQRYVRFYEDGLKKSADALENQFDLLKRERQIFTPDGLNRTNQRMARMIATNESEQFFKVQSGEYGKKRKNRTCSGLRKEQWFPRGN